MYFKLGFSDLTVNCVHLFDMEGFSCCCCSSSSCLIVPSILFVVWMFCVCVCVLIGNPRGGRMGGRGGGRGGMGGGNRGYNAGQSQGGPGAPNMSAGNMPTQMN